MQGDFYFVRDHIFKKQCTHAYDVITYLQLWDFLKVNRVYSYLYPVHDVLIHDKLFNAIVGDYVTAHDYTTIMRSMEYISKYGWDDWKLNYIYAYRLDIVKAVNVISHYMFNSLYDPSFQMCKRRLLREFHELTNETDHF